MSLLKGVVFLYIDRFPFFWSLFIQHLQLSFLSIGSAALIGSILAILMVKNQLACKIITPLINILYTIPSIALFGLFIPLMGIGFFNAWCTLSLYGILPVARYMFVGLQNVEKSTIEAALLDGCSVWRILFLIELPLACPYILTGIRTMTIMIIALAGIAAFIGAGGLGVAVWRGITMNYPAMIVAGSLLIALLAIFIDFIFSYLQKD